MGKFDGVLLCTDLDGTALRGDKSISDENREAMEYFKANGGLLTFITGRLYFFAEAALNAIRPNAPIGTINGGAIYDFEKRRYLWRRELPRDAFALVRYIEERMPGLGIQANTFDEVLYYRENVTMEWFRRVTGLPNLPLSDLDSVKVPLSKFVFGTPNEDEIERLAALLYAHPDADKFDYIHSEKTLYEILPKGCSKGDLLLRLAELLGIDRKRTVAVGDYDNDVSMLKAAGLGVAVANASDAARAAADLVTVSNEEHALARIICDLDERKIRL